MASVVVRRAQAITRNNANVVRKALSPPGGDPMPCGAVEKRPDSKTNLLLQRKPLIGRVVVIRLPVAEARRQRQERL